MSLIGYARVSTAEGRQWQASTCLPPSSSTGTPPGWAKRSLGEDMPACPWSPSSCHTSRPSVGPTSCSPANTDGKNAELSLTCHFALFRNRPQIRKKRMDRMRVGSDWRWHLDEVFVKINGEHQYLWRTVDHERVPTRLL